ncbi:MAG: sel1 repeat family protein [Clostridia bacterium]|nr:sel1 repeat family protein [Clostridia bacterium]
MAKKPRAGVNPFTFDSIYEKPKSVKPVVVETKQKGNVTAETAARLFDEGSFELKKGAESNKKIRILALSDGALTSGAWTPQITRSSGKNKTVNYEPMDKNEAAKTMRDVYDLSLKSALSAVFAIDAEKNPDDFNKRAQELYKSFQKHIAEEYLFMGWFQQVCKENKRAAFNLYKKSSDEKNELASLFCGYMSELGSGTDVDYNRAIDFYERAKNNSIAKFNLANLYSSGVVTPNANTGNVKTYCTQEADRLRQDLYANIKNEKNPALIYALGKVFRSRNEDEKAEECIKLAAEKDVKEACIDLGDASFKKARRTGNSTDYETADRYYDQATRLGSDVAHAKLVKLRKKHPNLK